MSMVKMSKQEMKLKKKTAYDRILNVAEKMINHSLIVKKFPANSCNPNDIRRHLSFVKNKFGFIPDLMVFDYADIMKSNKLYEERRFEIESIYYDLRNIAEEYNSVNWTASQTTRNWKEKDIIEIEDVDECYKKAAASDVIVSLNQTLEERRSHPQTARLFVSKNRDDESQVEIQIKTDWSKAWIGNL
jgi:replicative DNA helicase